METFFYSTRCARDCGRDADAVLVIQERLDGRDIAATPKHVVFWHAVAFLQDRESLEFVAALPSKNGFAKIAVARE